MMNEMRMQNVDRFLTTDPVRETKNSIMLYRFMLGRISAMQAETDPEMSSRIRRALADMPADGGTDTPA